jgi:hypothetical protein
LPISSQSAKPCGHVSPTDIYSGRDCKQGAGNTKKNDRSFVDNFLYAKSPNGRTVTTSQPLNSAADGELFWWTSNTVRHILADLIDHIAGIRPRILINARALVSKRNVTEITTMFI